MLYERIIIGVINQKKLGIWEEQRELSKERGYVDEVFGLQQTVEKYMKKKRFFFGGGSLSSVMEGSGCPRSCYSFFAEMYLVCTSRLACPSSL